MNLEEARSILIDHSRSHRNGHFPELPTHFAKITNPICGDLVELKIQAVDGVVFEAGFKSAGCAISMASTSLLCQEMKGKALTELAELAQMFEGTLLASQNLPWPQRLKNFDCFEHLRVNPARKACALLSWIALKSALKSNQAEGKQ